MSKNKLYIQLYNIHGLIRGNNLELGIDSDTGGQTKYVLELGLSLSRHPDVEMVEIVTRQINDKTVSKDYSVKLEEINKKLRIVRLQAGGKKYIKKEQLWPHLEEFVDKSIKYLKSQNRLPDIIHSHYVDAGFVCSELTKFFGTPFIHTGHSLGRLKLENLLNSGMSKREIEKRYKISRRIDAEETTIFLADRIITSTNDEIKKQYSRYDNMQEDKFIVIPPAIDLDHFFSYKEQREWDEESRIIRTDIRDELWKFFTNMYKPIIFSLCRPEKRKNISGLIEAYGEDKELQERANLAIFAGIRKDIQKMEDAEKEVLTEMLLLMDKYNLYGKMAIPKRHDVDEEVPEMYRIAAESQGVFVNSAFSENFGLTLIEAAASGLPVVATNDGGPRDIIKNLKNGVLVNVEKSSNIAKGIKKILSDEKLWNDYSRNGINNINDYYSWEAHTATYIRAINKLMKEHEINPKTFISTGKKLFKFKKLMMFDIDDTILGNEKAVKRLKEVLENRGETVGFGVATGRTIESACKVLDENDFIKPDIIVSSVGSEIYYRNHDDYVFSTGWEAHISYLWKREEIIETLKDIKFLEYQPEENQRKYKVSYNFDGDEEKARQVARILVQNKLKVNLIVSHGSYIDILPFRASKGRGIRYIAYRWNIPHNRILVAGDSGNDTDMLTGELLGIVVANYSPELEELKNNRKIYFASKKYADGVIEGINYYEFLT